MEFGVGGFNLEQTEGNRKKKRKKKNKQLGTDHSNSNPVMDETLDMVWSRVSREAPMSPTFQLS